MEHHRQFLHQKRQSSAQPIRPLASSSLYVPRPVPEQSQPYQEQRPFVGWSLKQIAITQESLPPEHHATVNPAQEYSVASSSTPVLQPKMVQSAGGNANTTGLPDQLKVGVENLSGVSLDDVHVHYNSSQPARVYALAYTQGTEIHVGPGQEQHVAHEAWHVVQQKQGRVVPTVQVEGMPINDHEGLEREADRMGARAANEHSVRDQIMPSDASPIRAEPVSQRAVPPIQRMLKKPDGTLLSSFRYYEELYKDHKAAIDSLEEGEDKIIKSKEEFLQFIEYKEKETGILRERAMEGVSESKEEEEDDGKREMDEEEKPLSQPLPVLLRDILDSIKVDEDIKQLSTVLNEGIDPIHYKAVLFEGNAVDTRGMSKDDQQKVLLSYLESKAAIASCYPAATRLLELVGASSEGVSFEGGKEAGSFDLDEQQSLIQDLCRDLQKAQGAERPSIFKIQLGGKGKGGHGFTFTIQGDAIYKLEALAGLEEDAQLMLSNITTGAEKYSLEDVQAALNLIVSDNVKGRIKGAGRLGWNAKGIALIEEVKEEGKKKAKNVIKDPMNIYWIAFPLASEERIRERVAQQIQSTRERILAIVSSEGKGKRKRK